MVAHRHWTASVSAGCVFDRYMFEGTSLFSSGFNRLNLGDGPFAALNVGARYRPAPSFGADRSAFGSPSAGRRIGGTASLKVE